MGILLLALALARRSAPPGERPGWRALAEGAREGLNDVFVGAPRRAFDLWALGRAADAYGLRRPARWLFRRAIDSAHAHRTFLDETRARADLGLSYLEEAPASSDGVEHATAALEGFERCGATPEARALSEALTALGGDAYPPPRAVAPIAKAARSALTSLLKETMTLVQRRWE